MSEVEASPPFEFYEFSVFRLEVPAKILTVDDRPVQIAPKVLDCLLALIDSDGRLVTKDELVSRVWPETGAADSVVSYTVSQLRKTLARYDADTVFVETFPKRGFRFAAELRNPAMIVATSVAGTVIERSSVEEIWIEEYEDETPALPAAPRRSVGRLTFVAVAILIVALVAFAGWRSLRAQPTAKVSSVAVLPVRTFSEADADDSLRLRMMDALISRLGGIPTLSVRPTSATSKFLDSQDDPVAIGRKLEVDAVLDGRVQRENNRLRVTFQLISSADGRTLWSGQFDGAEDRSLELQDSVAARLVGYLGAGRGAAHFSTSSAEAYEEYQKGRFFWQKRTQDGLMKAIESYRRAIERDPNFAEAYAGLADSYYMLVDYSYDTAPKNVELARINLDRALGLNPSLAAAYVTRARIEASNDWNWPAAEASALRAIDLDPNNSAAHLRLGMSIMPLGRFEDGEAAIRRARELDPTSPAINMNLGVALLAQRKFPEACRQFERAIELDPGFAGPKWFYSRCLRMSGELPQAHEAVARALETDGDTALAAAVRSAAGNDSAVLRSLLAAWSKTVGPTGATPFDLAIVNMQLGEHEAALGWLEKAVADRHPWAPSIISSPEFDILRETPRYRATLEKLNLR